MRNSRGRQHYCFISAPALRSSAPRVTGPATERERDLSLPGTALWQSRKRDDYFLLPGVVASLNVIVDSDVITEPGPARYGFVCVTWRLAVAVPGQVFGIFDVWMVMRAPRLMSRSMVA